MANLSSNWKLFAADTSLFSVAKNIHTSATTLSYDLNVTTNWAFQWKIVFNPDLSKKAQEVIFSRKIKTLFHPTLLFNKLPLSNNLFQKHLGLTLDIKLNFSEHIKSITKKNLWKYGSFHIFQEILKRPFILTLSPHIGL